MSHTSNRANSDIVRDFLWVADLLEKPQLAQLYSYLAREDEATGHLAEPTDGALGETIRLRLDGSKVHLL